MLGAHFKDYDSLYREFRWAIPARYNIGVDICDRWAAREPGRLAMLLCARRRPQRGNHLRRSCARPRTGSPTCCARRASSAATASRSSCRRRRRWPPRTSRSTSSARSRCRSQFCSARTRWPTACRIPAPSALLTNAQGLRQNSRRSAPRCRTSPACISVDGGFADLLGKASPDFTPVDTAAEDPAMMIYTSGTTGQPKGALHAHRVLLGHLPGAEIAALSVSAGGRQLLDAGRLGLGRRPARRAAAEPASRRAGRRAPLRQVRSGGSLRADGESRHPQRVHSADRVAHDARGAEPARPLRFQAAQHGLGRRVARHRGAGMGQGGLRADHQRVLRPDRMQSCARLLRATWRLQARRDRQAGARP